MKEVNSNTTPGPFPLPRPPFALSRDQLPSHPFPIVSLPLRTAASQPSTSNHRTQGTLEKHHRIVLTSLIKTWRPKNSFLVMNWTENFDFQQLLRLRIATMLIYVESRAFPVSAMQKWTGYVNSRLFLPRLCVVMGDESRRALKFKAMKIEVKSICASGKILPSRSKGSICIVAVCFLIHSVRPSPLCVTHMRPLQGREHRCCTSYMNLEEQNINLGFDSKENISEMVILLR